MRKDSKGTANHLHWHNDCTCHGFPTLVACVTDAIKHCYLGRVLEKTDTDASGQVVKCYSMIVSSFDHWTKHGRFVAETFVAARPFGVAPEIERVYGVCEADKVPVGGMCTYFESEEVARIAQETLNITGEGPFVGPFAWETRGLGEKLGGWAVVDFDSISPAARRALEALT